MARRGFSISIVYFSNARSIINMGKLQLIKEKSPNYTHAHEKMLKIYSNLHESEFEIIINT